MTTLFSSCRKIKPSNPRFAFPIQVPKGAKVRPYDDADAAWWAEQQAEAEGRHLERLCEESAVVEAAARGLSFA